jgi:hypothetical protein
VLRSSRGGACPAGLAYSSIRKEAVECRPTPASRRRAKAGDLDLAGFDAIVPCGLAAVEMTSIARELGDRAPSDLAARTRDAVRRAFEARLG